MIIKSIKIQNFRCHEDFNFDFKKKTSIIVGENGSGKTSVLEAIYEALRGKSFRAVDKDILKRDADYYRVELDFSDGRKTIVIFGNIDGSGELRKQFLIDGKKTTRLPKKNSYPVVLFLPDDLHLISSSPTRKRDYFDRVFSELDDTYLNILNKYEKSLKQRNDLLKKYTEDGIEGLRSVIFSWNFMLSKYGVEIRKKRKRFIDEINNRITNTYHSIADNNDEVKIIYEMQGDECSEEEYLKRLENELQRDLILGHTGFGVHRDNFIFLFNKTDADGSASRGEVRSIILAQKFIEAELIFNKTRKKPVVLLDDVFSELDEKRQKSLTQNFKDNQVIITSVEIAK